MFLNLSSAFIARQSDARLKRNIRAIDDSLRKTLLIGGVTYSYNFDPMGTNRRVGVIAQDVVRRVSNASSLFFDIRYWMTMLLRSIYGLGIMLVLLSSDSRESWSCSTFAPPHSTYLGENFDWHVGSGQLLVNKKNTKKNSLKMFETDQSIEWVSRYGSLTFNQIALDHPISGMNQAGLIVVASENFGEGSSKAEGRLTLNEYQWVQYQLDNFATVQEVFDHVKEVGISSIMEELHYFVCDASAQCGVVEVEVGNRQLKVYSGGNFPVQVLTNTGYLEVLHKFLHPGSDGSPFLPLDPFDSNERFLFLARKLNCSLFGLPRCGPVSLDTVLSLLVTVKQPGFTQWLVAFDSATKNIKYKLQDMAGVGSLDLNVFDFASDSGVLTADLRGYLAKIPNAFRLMTHADNVKLVTESMSYLGSVLPAGGEEKLKSYPVVLNRAVFRLKW